MNRSCLQETHMVVSVVESHRRPIYAIAWNLVDASLADTFASVGANRVSVYRLALPEIAAADDPPVAPAAAPKKDGKRLGGQSGASPAECTLQQAYCDQDPDEHFYCCAWGVRVGPDGATATSVLAVAGALFQIKLLDLCAGQVACVLRGHGGAVNELQFHPRERALLVSAAADESVRLWHVGVGQCLAMFAGHSGHRDAVVSLDVRLDGRALVTGAIDGAIKLWALDAPPLQRRVVAANEAAASAAAALASAAEDDEATAAAVSVVSSANSAWPMGEWRLAPLVFQAPLATYDRVHFDAVSGLCCWVDCVRWAGAAVLSRGTDGRIALWRPRRTLGLALGLGPAEATAGTAAEVAAAEGAAAKRAPARPTAKGKAGVKSGAKGGSGKGAGIKGGGAAADDGAAGADADTGSAHASGTVPGMMPSTALEGARDSHELLAELEQPLTAGIWFLRFGTDLRRTRLALGDTNGQVAVWDLSALLAMAEAGGSFGEGSGSVGGSTLVGEEQVGAEESPLLRLLHPLPLTTLSMASASSSNRKRRKGAKGKAGAGRTGTCLVRCASISVDGRHVAFGCQDGSVHVSEAV